jgi:hypothetical protein
MLGRSVMFPGSSANAGSADMADFTQRMQSLNKYLISIS